MIHQEKVEDTCDTILKSLKDDPYYPFFPNDSTLHSLCLKEMISNGYIVSHKGEHFISSQGVEFITSGGYHQKRIEANKIKTSNKKLPDFDMYFGYAVALGLVIYLGPTIWREILSWIEFIKDVYYTYF